MSLRADKKSANDTYFDDPIDIDSEGNPLTLLDIVAKDENIVDTVDLKIKAERLIQHIDATLTPRERMIVFKRYGLDGDQEKTQMELANELGISRSYVSRIEKKALNKIKDAYQKEAKQRTIKNLPGNH